MSMNIGLNYERIKHLVEVDDDVIAVFTIDFSWKIDNVTVADNKNDIDINSINKIRDILKNDISQKVVYDTLIGNLKWKIIEFSEIRIMIIYEQDGMIVVLMNKEVSLGKTIDTIFGYYYDREEGPKSLF